MWKNKYESLSANRSASSDIENRKLLNDIERHKEELNELDRLKNMQIN